MRKFALAMLAASLVLVARTAGAAEPAVCKVGVYVVSLSPIDFTQQRVDVDAYVWIKCPLSVPVENMLLSIVGAAAEDRQEPYNEDLPDAHYRYERIRMTLRVPLSLRSYPFDEQRVVLDIESTDTADEMVFAVDDDPVLGVRPRCCLDESVRLPDWTIERATPSADVHTYPTKFGYDVGTYESQRYPRFRLEIVMHREVRPYLWKVLLALLIVLSMAYVSGWWPTDNLDGQSSVLIAALLSVVALHLTERTALPSTGYLVTGDLFFIHAYAMLLVMLVVASIEHRLTHAGDVAGANRLQRLERIFVPVLTLAGWAAVIVFSL